MNKQVIEKLQGATFFCGLNEEQLNLICTNSRLLTFNKDDIIFCQDDEAKAFFLIISGCVSIIKENVNAEQAILHVFKEGESFAEPAALVMGLYPASAYAASSCELLEIKVSVLKKLIHEDTDIAMRMIGHLSRQLFMLVNEFEQYKTMGVPKRLALFLLELSEKNPEQKEVDLPFNKSVLAAQLGIQPGTLSRAFNQLAEFGVISDRSGHIILEDVKRLNDYINSSD